MKQKTIYQKPMVQQVEALTADKWLATSPVILNVNAAKATKGSGTLNDYNEYEGSWN